MTRKACTGLVAAAITATVISWIVYHHHAKHVNDDSKRVEAAISDGKEYKIVRVRRIEPVFAALFSRRFSRRTSILTNEPMKR
jgi:hypothetical protein